MRIKRDIIVYVDGTCRLPTRGAGELRPESNAPEYTRDGLYDDWTLKAGVKYTRFSCCGPCRYYPQPRGLIAIVEPTVQQSRLNPAAVDRQ